AFGVTISKEDIEATLELYARNSRLMTEIHSLRALDQPKLTGSEFLKVAIANSSVRKDFANRELQDLVVSLKERPGLDHVRARLMLGGSIVDSPAFIDIVEHAGAVVVTDSLCTGTRSFWDGERVIPRGIKVHDEIDRLVSNTYAKTLCPRIMNGHEVRLSFLKKEIERARVDGVVLQRLEFCDLHGCENMLTQHELEVELGIPVLSIDREYFLGDTGRLRTRVEAFLEKIGV
nr:2-hydroxyacyl-CoA dehydratase family protein [Candidatus Sigynarchaeota archaeon]